METQTEINKHLNLLGFRAQDKVTGFNGVIASVSFDLFGHVRCLLIPHIHEKKLVPLSWFGVDRLEITSKEPIIESPYSTNEATPKKEELQ